MNIVITGCTGVGKTTIAKSLEKEINAILIDEPILENEFLIDSYKSPEYFGTFSQISFMLSFSKLQDSWPVNGSKLIIQERCLSDCLFVFSKNLLIQNRIESREFTLLKNLHDYLINKSINKVDRYIYLSSPIEIVEERLRLRGREFENKIDLEFLRIQNELYNQWFTNKQNVLQVENIDIASTVMSIINWLKK